MTKANFEVPAILSIYDQLARWVAAPQRRRVGSPREVYREGIDPLAASADEEICDVAVPFTMVPAAGQPLPSTGQTQ